MKNLTKKDFEKTPQKEVDLINQFLEIGEKSPLIMMRDNYRDHFLCCPYREDALEKIERAINILNNKN